MNLFVDKTKWERLALPLVHIFIPIMLQNPCAKSKPRVHAKYLTSRLKKWNEGDLKSLIQEAEEIQKRLNSNKGNKKKVDADQKAFIKLMLLGKVGVASKRINNEDSIKGVHQLNEKIKGILQDKHPKGREAKPDILLPERSSQSEAVMFEVITADKVFKTAKQLKGSGGPTLIDSDM